MSRLNTLKGSILRTRSSNKSMHATQLGPTIYLHNSETSILGCWWGLIREFNERDGTVRLMRLKKSGFYDMVPRIGLMTGQGDCGE
ncbi:hypothetical protein Ancab_000827 [Ancistrocladus abbreviatus]